MGLDMYLYARKPLSGFDASELPFYEDGEHPTAYVSGYEHSAAEERERYRALIAHAGLAEIADPETPSAHVRKIDGALDTDVCVAYWRKANHIHAWFVDHVQDGVDECQESPVTREQLEQLRDTCKKVLDGTFLEDGLVSVGQRLTEGRWEQVTEEGKIVVNPEFAEEHLPTQGGFFFGSTDYDEWYVRDVVSTMDQIDRALKAPGDVQFIYQSSW